MIMPLNNDAAFHKQLDKNKEQADGLKYHGEYELDHDAVPTKRGYANIQGMNKFVVDPDIPGATAKIWIPPKLLLKVFGACHICHKHTALCLGHDGPKPKTTAEGKRPAAAAANAAAQRRMKAKAEKAKKGGFSFE